MVRVRVYSVCDGVFQECTGFREGVRECAVYVHESVCVGDQKDKYYEKRGSSVWSMASLVYGLLAVVHTRGRRGLVRAHV